MRRDNVIGLKPSTPRRQNAALALASLLCMSAFAEGSAHAFAEVQGARFSSGGLDAAPGTPTLRPLRRASWGAPPTERRAAFDRFTRGATGSAWQGLWDSDTFAPIRLFGAGLPAPMAVSSPDRAEAHARAFISAWMDLLAPGAAPSDLRLAANDLDHGLRTVAFAQYVEAEGAGAVPVIGGGVSLRYLRDRLIMIASEAYATEREGARLGAPRIDGLTAELAASAWAAERHAEASLLEGAELAALPLVGPSIRELRLVYRVVIDAQAPRARYAVYLDARTGAPVASSQLLRFDQAPVLFDVPIREPKLGRKPFPAPRLSVAVDGAAAETDAAGLLVWPAGGKGQVALSAHGALATVKNMSGADAGATLSATDGSPVTWSLATAPAGDGQLSAYIHANLAKAHAEVIAPTMSFLDAKLPIYTNVADARGCNAFWDGSSLNFYAASAECDDAARIADIVYHEFGHGFHQHAVIPNVGQVEPSLGEGAADTLAVSITHDPKLAAGLFRGSSDPMRDLTSPRRWPEDISNADPHQTGLIYATAMWDLRSSLVSELGDAEGNAVTDALFYQSLRRASDILTVYPEMLAADDDDGDLANGTPHICAINRAFAAHGIAAVFDEAGLTLTHEPLARLSPEAGSYPIKVKARRLYPACATSPVDVARVYVRTGSKESAMELAPEGDGYAGEIPKKPDGTSFQYRIEIGVAGSPARLPDNLADDAYDAFVGEVEPLYCNDFESQIDGWTFGDSKGGKGDFEWGAPLGAAGDPSAAASGVKVLGDRLSGSGAYANKRTVFADSPRIDLRGKKGVRLQYRRWLTCEDGAFDQATIYVNDLFAWQNQGTSQMDGSLTHRDAEWRWKDIALDPLLAHSDGTMKLRFEIQSDAERVLGGWTLDDLCVVAWKPAAPTAGMPDAGMPDAGPVDVPDAGPEEPADPSLVLSGGCACETTGARGRSEAGGARWALVTLLAVGLGIRRRRTASARRRVISPRPCDLGARR